MEQAVFYAFLRGFGTGALVIIVLVILAYLGLKWEGRNKK